MHKDNLSFLGELSDEDRLFINRIFDLARYANEKYMPRFSHFLDERQRYLAENALLSECADNFIFFGGYDDAKRVMLGVFPEYTEPDRASFPISPITFTYRTQDRLSHRDFLGSLMALDIKRDTVGDIIVSEGKTCVFLDNKMHFTVVNEITKVGRVGVRISDGFDESVMSKQSFTQIKGTVSKSRLDCIISLALGVSREKAAALIKNTGVNIDYRLVTSPSVQIDEGAVFSIRGYGKYKFDRICGFTRKNRVTVIINKYD